MLLSVVVFCTASVFCGCGAYTYHAPDTQRTLPKLEEKEYGTESKHYPRYAERYYVSTEQLDWFSASYACALREMKLACAPTVSERRELENYLREHFLEPEDKYSGYWIGGFRYTSYNPYRWVCDREEVGDLGWFPGEPNVSNEDCMEVKKEFMMYGWNNHECELPKRYICKGPLYAQRTVESYKNISYASEPLHDEAAKASVNEENEIKPKPTLILEVLGYPRGVKSSTTSHLSTNEETATTDTDQYSIPASDHTESFVKTTVHDDRPSSLSIKLISGVKEIGYTENHVEASEMPRDDESTSELIETTSASTEIYGTLSTTEEVDYWLRQRVESRELSLTKYYTDRLDNDYDDDYQYEITF